MFKRFMTVTIECVLDLGITVVYATIAGLLIAAIVASDDGSLSIVSSVLYAGILPLGVVLLIGCDAGFRVLAELRAVRTQAHVAVTTLPFGSSRTA